MHSISISSSARLTLISGRRLFLRHSDGESDYRGPLLEVTEEEDGIEFASIRCPLCKWRPTRDCLWTCWDCDHPEYFFGGCGTEWNTFETRGRCPTCAHQWIWTSCLKCWMWSRHEDWYEDTT